MCLLLSLRLSATQKVQELPRKLAPLTCTSGSLSSRGHGSLPLQNGCVADGAPPAAVLLCSVHSLLHCFLLRHRMENMCHLNIEQFRGPKSQLQNTKIKKKKQREVIKHCSFCFKRTSACLNISRQKGNGLWKKANNYTKHQKVYNSLALNQLLAWWHIHSLLYRDHYTFGAWRPL